MPMGIKTVVGGIRVGPVLNQEQAKALNRGLAMYRGVTRTHDLDKAIRGELVVPLRHVSACAKPLWRTSGQRMREARRMPWKVKCLACQHENCLPDKPGSLNRGWPKHRCQSCRKEFRVGANYACVACDLLVMNCTCTPVEGQQPPPISERARRILNACGLGRPDGGHSGSASS